MSRSRYNIVKDEPGKPLYIEDVGGPSNMSVTNDAETVVKALVGSEILTPGRKLYYFDSEGQLDEILIKDGKFAGFAPGPNRRGMGEYLPGKR